MNQIATLISMGPDPSDEVTNSEAYGEAYHRKFGHYPLLQVSVEGQRGAAPTVDKGDGMTGAALGGVGDTAAFGTLDEIGGVVDTVLSQGGDGDFRDRLGQNILRNRAIMAGDEKNHPYARLGGQLLGGALIPFGAGARSAGELARVGAIGGGAYGFGSGKGGILDRTPNALGGAVLGGVGG